jgi:hypothetical protein
VVSDRHMVVLHGGNILGQVHYVPRLVAAATDDDGSVCSANGRKKDANAATVTSARARPGRLHVSPLAQSIIHHPLALFPLAFPTLITSFPNE